MNAPLIWIVIPLALTGLLWFFHKQIKHSALITFFICLALVVLAFVLPVGSFIKMGLLTFEIPTTLTLFGRRLVLEAADRYWLILVYGLGALWALGIVQSRVHRSFSPLSLLMIVLLVAARAVEPFLYAALLVAVAVLASLPLMLPPGGRPGSGITRYLIFQTLAVPCILLAGWAASMVDINPSNEVLRLVASVSLGLGLAFWLAVFPFYTWVPLVAGEAHPFAAGFVLSLLTTTALFLGLDFLNGFGWLRNSEIIIAAFRLVGVFMVVTGGVWAAFQEDLTRLFGYAIIVDLGAALLAISLRSEIGLTIFAAGLIPRLISLFVWALALACLQGRQIPLTFTGVTGLGHRLPLLAAALGLACLSLGGLPLLAAFPARQALLVELAAQSLPVAIWTLLGGFGLLLGGFRLLHVLLLRTEQGWRIGENLSEGLLLSTGIIILLLIGIFPGGILGDLPQTMLLAFPNLP
ncbi:MAG TPA: proton-conducting transporter membrane subunit [Anaerolineaceae bacterium]|jgi:formate hydrogenlyase subunit 3/multisubunit Na+/H+ antiporter MnhD subunit|nr:proton-conducting transporter membrane subunit [Anaerolineaceae bacterium]